MRRLRRRRRRSCPYALLSALFFRWRFLSCWRLLLFLCSLSEVFEYILLVFSTCPKKTRIIYFIFSICCYFNFIWIFSLPLFGEILLLLELNLNRFGVIYKAVFRRIFLEVKRSGIIFLWAIELKTIFVISWSYWAFWFFFIIISFPLRFRWKIKISDTHFTLRNYITLLLS